MIVYQQPATADVEVPDPIRPTRPPAAAAAVAA